MTRLRRARIAALVAAVVAFTGAVETSHRHAPKPDGWHQSGPQGDAAHDEDRNSCSICRLAHQTSSTPTLPLTAAAPLPREAVPAEAAPASVSAGPFHESSPRAPPCLASC